MLSDSDKIIILACAMNALDKTKEILKDSTFTKKNIFARIFRSSLEEELSNYFLYDIVRTTFLCATFNLCPDLSVQVLSASDASKRPPKRVDDFDQLSLFDTEEFENIEGNVEKHGLLVFKLQDEELVDLRIISLSNKFASIPIPLVATNEQTTIKERIDFEAKQDFSIREMK